MHDTGSNFLNVVTKLPKTFAEVAMSAHLPPLLNGLEQEHARYVRYDTKKCEANRHRKGPKHALDGQRLRFRVASQFLVDGAAVVLAAEAPKP